MSDFEKLQQEVKEEQLDEEDLYKGEEEEKEEEQAPPVVDEKYLEKIKNMSMDQALYYLGLAGARFKKAPDPHAFALAYAQSTAAFLKIIGFQEALAETVGNLMLDPKKRLIIGLVTIGLGLVLTPANAQPLPAAEQQAGESK